MKLPRRFFQPLAAGAPPPAPRVPARPPRPRGAAAGVPPVARDPPRPFSPPRAAGAPAPYRELPVRLERMIHFVPPHIDKMRAKVPELIAQVDVVLGNLEDAIPADKKVEARRG